MGFLEDRANLAGRTAVVMGGGGGLGRACTLDLARAGMQVAVADRHEVWLQETLGQLAQEGCTAFGRVVDVRDAEAVTAFYDEVAAEFGPPIHTLVNVVGGTFEQAFADSNPRGWQALIASNFTWLLHAIHQAVPRLAAAGGASIINLTSVEGHRAAPGFAVYAGMKAAVENFSRSLAVELAEQGIRVNTIAPDFVPTENTMKITAELSGPPDPPVDELIADMLIPLGRRGNYADVGGCALFLASDLSAYVTGSSLHPDGGTFASSGWLRWPVNGWKNLPPPEAARLLLADREARARSSE